MGIKSIFLGGDGWSDIIFKYAGNAVKGSYCTQHWTKENKTKKNIDFIKSYKAKFNNSEASATAILAYDAVQFLVNAIKRAGKFDRKIIRDKLAKTKKFSGITGIITLDENRNAVKSVVINKFLKNKMIFYKMVHP